MIGTPSKTFLGIGGVSYFRLANLLNPMPIQAAM